MADMELNKRITRWREGEVLSPEEAAARLGCSVSSLRNYEGGKEPKNKALRYRILKILAAFERTLPVSDG